MNKETFWSIIIEPDWVQAALWSKSGENLRIISSSNPAKYESHNLIEVIDSCLTDAITDFPDDEKEPSKTVFGVPSFWVKDGSIEKEHLDKIREICTKLSLSPSGFVVLSEAVAHSIKLLEGSPLTGVVMNFSKNIVSVSIFKLGNLLGTVNVGRSVSIFDDVVEGLSRFDMKEPLPTRFLLFGGDMEDVDEQNQVLIKSDWTEFGEKNLRFLHTPQFEIFDHEKKAIAISIAGASEIGTIKNVEYTGRKIAENNSPETSSDDNNVKKTSDLSAADIGFVIDEDIAEKMDDADESEKAVSTEKEEETAVGTKTRKIPFPKLPSLKNMNSKNKDTSSSTDGSRIKINKFRQLNKPRAIVIGMILLLLLSIASFAAAWWYLPKADVTIYVSPKRLEADDAIALDVNPENLDPENMIFQANLISVEVSETKQKNTTGTITVGEKATGRITVRNGTSDPIQLSVGDSIFGPDDLEFFVLESASVSAALSPTEPGQVSVDAEAADIGAEYNIAKDEKLTLEGYSPSEIDAVVNESFSGGSSEEIVAISQNDLDILESELLAELKRRAISQLESEVTGGRFIPESIETEVLDQQFSGSVGDESSTVSLTLTIGAKGISILDETVERLSQELLSDQIPEGFRLRPEQIEANFDLVEIVDDGLYDFDVVLSANLLPEVDIDNIKSQIKGKYPPAAEEFLSSIQGFSKAEVSLNPRFPGRLGIIPRIDKNISIEIQAER